VHNIKEQMLMMSTLYMHDKPVGFGFMIRDIDCPVDLENEHRLVLKTADKLIVVRPSIILSQLGEYARCKHCSDYEDRRNAFVYVVAADRVGLLPRDDFNCPLLIKEIGKTLVSGMVSHLDWSKHCYHAAWHLSCCDRSTGCVTTEHIPAMRSKRSPT
jgi:hypothetical protein